MLLSHGVNFLFIIIIRHALITVVMISIYECKPSLFINAVNEHCMSLRDAPV